MVLCVCAGEICKCLENDLAKMKFANLVYIIYVPGTQFLLLTVHIILFIDICLSGYTIDFRL